MEPEKMTKGTRAHNEIIATPGWLASTPLSCGSNCTQTPAAIFR